MNKVLCALCFVVAARATYDHAKALVNVYLSGATYCEWSSVESWTCGPVCEAVPGIQDVTLVSDPVFQTFGYIAYNNISDSIIVVFRGSDNDLNYDEDYDFLMVDYPKGPAGTKVHMGFHYSYQSMSN